MLMEQSTIALPIISRARRILAQATSTTDPSLVAACIDEVAGCEQWPLLLAEIVSRLPPGPRTIDIIAAVVARRVPDHPLAVLAGKPKQVWAAFDMIDDGRVLRLRMAEGIISADEGYILSVDAPERDCTPVRIVRDRGCLLLTPLGPHDWLERNRAACPPSLLVIGDTSDQPMKVG